MKKSRRSRRLIDTRGPNVISNGTTRGTKGDLRMKSTIEEVTVARAAGATTMIKRLESSSAMALPSSHRRSLRHWMVPLGLKTRKKSHIAR